MCSIYEDEVFYVDIWIPEGSYRINVECISSNKEYDAEQLDSDIKKYNERNKEETAEFHEKLFTIFVIAMGNLFKNLISIIIGSDLSIDALVFDRYAKTSLTFFNQDNIYYKEGTTNPLFAKNTSAAAGLNKVFGVFQGIAASIYVIILVYMGIRVLLVSTADRRAKFKSLLVDWVKGIAILFLFPYAIRYAILLNHGIVTFIDSKKNGAIFSSSPTIKSNAGVDVSDAGGLEDSTGDNYMQTMYNDAKRTFRLSRAICWFIMLVQMVQFWVVYIKRLIKVTFLIAIFPLVTISYAIDKIGDGKSQAFDSWWKEFLLEVFIQSFHAINYVIVMGLVFEFARSNWFLAIIGTTYVVKGADIIRSLFAQMKGGGAGGPMDLAKSLVKTRMIASGIRKVGGVAKGMMTPINKGIGVIQLGRDKFLDGSYRHSEKMVDEARRERKETSTIQELVQKGSHVTVKRSKEENVALLKSLQNGKLSDEEMKKLIMKLADASEEDLIAALDELKCNDEFRGKVENLARLGSAAAILTSQRKGASSADIRQSVDICMKNLTNPNATKLLSDLGLNDESKLRNWAAQYSVSLDEDKRQQRLKREETMTAPSTTKSKVRWAANAVKNAGKGEYNLEELRRHADYLEDIRNNGTEEEKKLVEKNMEDANYSLEQFRANLAVQTINYSNTIDEEHRQECIDSAIDVLNSVKNDKNYKDIISNLEADVGIDGLQKGYIPTVTHREDNYWQEQETDLRKQFRTLLNDGKVDLGEKRDAYRDNYINEVTDEGMVNLVTGTVRTGVGMVTAPVRLSVAAATSAIAVGAIKGGNEKDDGGGVLGDIAAVVPHTAEATDKVLKLGGKLLTKGARKIGRTIEQQQEDLEIQRDAYKEGEVLIAEEAEAEYVRRVLEQRQSVYKNLSSKVKEREKKK